MPRLNDINNDGRCQATCSPDEAKRNPRRRSRIALRSMRATTTELRPRQSADAEGAAGLTRREIRDDGLAGDRGLAFRHQRLDAWRQIDVDPRAEADHADALAGADLLAFAHEWDDAARDQAGDLHHADAAARAGNEQ